MKKTIYTLLFGCLMIFQPSFASDVYPIAIFDFDAKSRHLKDLGKNASSIVFSELVVNPNLTLVDREELSKLYDEASLNLSGMVNSQQANQIGQLTGAKIIVTGSVFEIENKLMIVAKIIGSETGKVLGASVRGAANDSIFTLAEQLSSEIAETIAGSGHTLVAKTLTTQDRITALKEKLTTGKKPTLVVHIKEHHINRAVIDPAAETEMIYFSKSSGFEVFDNETEESKLANIKIVGEGFTEYATRKGDIIGVRARLEVKAVDQSTNKIIAIDRQTELEVDLSEMIAAKNALQKASANIAERMLPILQSAYQTEH